MGIERLSEFWPDWRITGILGEGSYGKVYSASREEYGLKTECAIKVVSIPTTPGELDSLRSEGMTDVETKTYLEEIVHDFVNEIKLMEKLKGAANIVTVEDYKILEKTDSIGWDIYIRMELLTPLSARLRSMTRDEIIKLGVDLCSALEACYANNIIHRDIKPANIFISPFGDYKIGDFGVAKELSRTNMSMSTKGTFTFMAPEVKNNKNYDSTADIYSLGLVLYTLFNNNRLPFIDPYAEHFEYKEKVEANNRRLKGEALPRPCNADDDLAGIILTACQFDPSKRFKNPTALKNALKRCVGKGDETIIAPPPPPRPAPDPIPQPPMPQPPIPPQYGENHKNGGKTRLIIIILITALVIAAAIGAFFLLRDDEKKKASAPNTEKTTTSEQEPSPEPETKPIDETEPEPEKEPEEVISYDISGLRAGDRFEFGGYEQNNDTSDGREKLNWIVLESNSKGVLLITERCIDTIPYNNENKNTSWSECTLREWLNNDFINNAFGEAELALLAKRINSNPGNASYNIDGGPDTEDKVFLLSIEEFNEYREKVDFASGYATDYCRARGAYISESYSTAWWWLRSPGINRAGASNVYGSEADTQGHYVNADDVAVRPVIFLSENPDEVIKEPDITGTAGQVSWSYTDGVLEISGDGSIPDYKLSGNKSPWVAQCTDIREIRIAPGVTRIGEAAFAWCDSVTSLVLPEGLREIGAAAFYKCQHLTDIYLPDSLTSIGNSAFTACYDLKNIYTDNNAYFTDKDGVLFNKSMERLIVYPAGRYDSYYAVPPGVREIGYEAFCWCECLEEISIPNTVRSIEGYAFFNCLSLKYVDIPASVSSIASGCFCDCPELTNIRMDNNGYYCAHDGVLYSSDMTRIIAYPAGKTASSFTLPYSVTTVGASAFSGCNDLNEITIYEGVTTVETNAFFEMKNDLTIICPSGSYIESYAKNNGIKVSNR